MKNELSRREFAIMASFAERKTERSEIARCNGMTVEEVEETIKELTERGMLNSLGMTEKGSNALEPYRVKRAVILAAGFGSRLVPITLNTPKPLVRVHGKRIIDGLLDAILSAGIEEIVIVRGYLAEQFDQLLYKYPMIKFVNNTLYSEANNISSALCVRELLSNAYVFEADLLISNPCIVRRYHYTSDFLGIKKEVSDDWCFDVKNGVIRGQMVGGRDCYQEVGISYWNSEDGKKLYKHLKCAYEQPDGKQYYWDQVPFLVYRDEYAVEICECQQEDIIEIDSFQELKAIDPAYSV